MSSWMSLSSPCIVCIGDGIIGLGYELKGVLKLKQHVHVSSGSIWSER